MPQPTQETIHDLLVRNVPREVVMGAEDALAVGAQRAYLAARGMDEGHLPHVVGQLRHFHMNEAFQRALAANGAEPSPIRGNGIVTGRTGAFTLARFNIPEGFWINGRRSQRQMSLANMAIKPLVQPELFSGYQPHQMPWRFSLPASRETSTSSRNPRSRFRLQYQTGTCAAGCSKSPWSSF